MDIKYKEFINKTNTLGNKKDDISITSSLI